MVPAQVLLFKESNPITECQFLMDGKVNSLSQSMDKHYNTVTVESSLSISGSNVYLLWICCTLACSAAEMCAVCIVNGRIREAGSSF